MKNLTIPTPLNPSLTRERGQGVSIHIEIFKTNVLSESAAQSILDEIGSHQPSYKCNFDLDDCDKVLRIENASGNVDANLIFNLLEKNNFSGSILE